MLKLFGPDIFLIVTAKQLEYMSRVRETIQLE